MDGKKICWVMRSAVMTDLTMMGMYGDENVEKS